MGSQVATLAQWATTKHFAGGRRSDATRRRRARLAADRPPPADPDLGPERREFERCWGDELQTAVNDVAWEVPAGLRTIVPQELQRQIADRLRSGEAVAPARVPEMAETVLERLRAALYA